MVKNENLCRKCARKGHTAKDCPVPKPDSASNGNKLNAISELISEMENDFSYLCSLGEDIPVAMFPCAVKAMSNSDARTRKWNVLFDMGSSDHYIVYEQNGIALMDTGTTRNYISRRFASRAGLSYEGVSTSKMVCLPNGQIMQVFGSTRFKIEMSEWNGPVKATVIELDADFDVVLGMEWF